MRWFKHMANASRDPKLMALVDECGLEGYGAFWLIVEAVADQWKPGDNKSPELELSPQSWRRVTGISPQKFRKISEKLASFSLVLVETVGENIKIKIPKLRELKDEYSRKSGQAPDNVASEGEGEEDKEEKYKKEEKKPVTHSGDFPVLKNPEENPKDKLGKNKNMPPPPRDYPDEFEKLWREHPRGSKRPALKAWWAAKYQGRISDVDLITAVRLRREADDWKRDGGKYSKHLSTWLNADGWLDVECKPPGEEQGLTDEQIEKIVQNGVGMIDFTKKNGGLTCRH